MLPREANPPPLYSCGCQLSLTTRCASFLPKTLSLLLWLLCGCHHWCCCLCYILAGQQMQGMHHRLFMAHDETPLFPPAVANVVVFIVVVSHQWGGGTPSPLLWRHYTRHCYMFIVTATTDEIHSNPAPIPIAIDYTTFNIYHPLSLLLQLLLPWYYCFHCWVVAWMLVVVLFPVKATGASLMTL